MISMAKTSTNTPPIVLRITQGRLNPYLVTALILAAFAGIWYLVSVFEGWKSLGSALNLAVFFSVTITYTILITHVIIKGHEKDLFQLTDQLPDRAAQYDKWLNQLHTYKNHNRLYIVFICIGLGHAMIGRGPLFRLISMKSDYVLFDLWMTILIVMTWIVITQASTIFVGNLRFFARLVKEHEIDILFTHKLSPYIRAGVRSTLAFMGAYSLFPLLQINDIFYLLFNPALLVFIPIVIKMISIPILPLRKRIRELRSRELSLIENAINGDRQALKDSRLNAEMDDLNIVDLITYKNFLREIKDLPVNIPIAFRLLLYILLPVLTWVAASLVDKLVVAFLKM